MEAKLNKYKFDKLVINKTVNSYMQNEDINIQIRPIPRFAFALAVWPIRGIPFSTGNGGMFFHKPHVDMVTLNIFTMNIYRNLQVP